MQKKKVVYIVSHLDKALAFEWLNDHLDKHKFELSFIMIGDRSTHLARFLQERKTPVTEITYTSAADLPKVFLKVFFLLFRSRPHVVHTHLWIANITGLFAAWLLRIPKRIFTRHHAMLHYQEYPSGRKWDVMCNALATQIIAISENVKNILIRRDGVKASKVQIIHHGFDLDYFQHASRVKGNVLREKYGIARDAWPVIGVVSRYLKLKGIQYIIPAFGMLRQKFPSAHLVLANAQGDYAKEIKSQLQTLPPTSFTEITFENDLAALYQMFDVFIHAPVAADVESFGQTYIEALAAGIPSVFTLSGVAPEFIRHEYNALVARFGDAPSLLESVEHILQNETLRNDLVVHGKNSVRQFSLAHMLVKLEALYV
ncbi:MAG: glycosyltransferase family 4 protein [Bacteroidota bacterium]